MQTNSKATYTWRLLLSLTILGLIISCENPGSAGGGIIPQSDLKFDTLQVSGFMVDSVNSNTGDLSYLPVGKFNDPLFGSLNVVAYLRPSIDVNLDSIITASDEAQLELSFDSTYTYGNGTITSDFGVYRVTDLWRGNELFLNDSVTYNSSSTQGTFSLSGENEAIVNLKPQAGSDPDTVVTVSNLYGFAIVDTTATSKIRAINPLGSKITTITGTDTTEIGLGSWGYLLDRQGASIPADRFVMHNSLESILQVNLDNLALVESANDILKAELIFHIDEETMDNSLSQNEVRPGINNLNLHYDIQFSKYYDLQFTANSATGFYDGDFSIYRFDVTQLLRNYLTGFTEDAPLYISLSPREGLLNSVLLHDQNVAGKEPKLVITSIQEDQ